MPFPVIFSHGSFCGKDISNRSYSFLDCDIILHTAFASSDTYFLSRIPESFPVFFLTYMLWLVAIATIMWLTVAVLFNSLWIENEELISQIQGQFASHTSVYSTEKNIHLVLTSFLFLKARFLFFVYPSICSWQFSLEF